LSSRRRVSRCKSRLLAILRGYVEGGLGEARHYTMLRPYATLFEDMLGCRPYPGTLNLRLDAPSARAWQSILYEQGPCLVYAPRWASLSPIAVIEALIYGVEPALAVRPMASRHPPDILELIACRRLREEIGDAPVYVIAGCGLLRCHREWRRRISMLVANTLSS